jgi:hypothetical protein
MLVLAGLSLLIPVRGLAIQTTNVQGIVYRADGSVAQGTMLVSWPGFTAADGSAVAAGNTTVTIAPDGSVNMALAPNAGANPQGSYYTVVYHMNDGTVQKEYWVVPQGPTATISELRARVVPAAVAQQSVTQQYVDTSISTSIGALPGSYLQLKGGTMGGALNLSSDPTSALQATTKQYVDNATASISSALADKLPLVGGALTGPLTLAADPASAMQAATKEYVDAHAGSQLPQLQSVIAGKGDGSAVAMPEKGVSITGTNGMVAWDEDLKAGKYDPRDPRWAGGIYGPTPAAAAQAMSNQMACDLAMGVVSHAVAKWPQGNFAVDQLLIAPGSEWEGVPIAQGGTHWHSVYANHQMAQAPISMTLTCSDGLSHTDNLSNTLVSHFTLQGCATGGCTNAPGDTGNYIDGGPSNTGIEMSNSGSTIEWSDAQYFGGYGIRIDGTATQAFHNTVYSDNEWYIFGQYKGVGESLTSPETSATTTGSTGSVTLNWTAVPGANGYVIYRGTNPGTESVFYMTRTNSFVDTGAASAGGVPLGFSFLNPPAAPGTITPTASTTGGTLAAGTYYYKVTSYSNDAWHGSAEFAGSDNMSDWTIAYGLFDPPTVYTYHHLADILSGGGYSHMDHPWAQLGQVGIAQPYGLGQDDTFENVRADFARLEGIFVEDANVTVQGGVVDGSCGATNAQTINTGQGGLPQLAGTCQQMYLGGEGDRAYNLIFSQNGGFGPSYQTADYVILGGMGTGISGIPQPPAGGLGVLAGFTFQPTTTNLTNVTGPAPSVTGLWQVNPNDSSPITYTGFSGVQYGQDFYVAGGNANVTLQNNPPFLVTCTGANINLGSVKGYLHFQNYLSGYVTAVQVCDTAPTVASSETVAFSAAPTFSAATRASVITLTANITGFTLAAGADGQEKTLTFCQNGTGGFTVAAPVNVHGFFSGNAGTVGSTAGKCSAQHFTYSAGQTAWLADSPGVINE